MNSKDGLSLNYFDKRTSEEDMPIHISEKIQDKYEQLELLYDNFFDDNSLSNAKVRLHLLNIIAKFKRRKR
jgi:hypothetical protein